MFVTVTYRAVICYSFTQIRINYHESTWKQIEIRSPPHQRQSVCVCATQCLNILTVVYTESAAAYTPSQYINTYIPCTVMLTQSQCPALSLNVLFLFSFFTL